MNKCAKFHKDSPSGKKVKFNLARAIELSETAVFGVQLCIETSCKRATSVAHLTNFSFEFFQWNFHRQCLSTFSIPWCKKVKNDQKQDLEQQSNSPRYALRILIYRASPIIPTLVLLWPPISVGTTTSIVWAERLLATFTCAELLLSATRCMEWPFVASLYVAFIRPRLEYCSAVWCGASPALLKDVEKVQLRVARAIVRNTTLQDVSTLQQARLPTLSWRRREHCLGLLWQLSIGKGPPALQASLVPCAQLRSTRFSHSFRFPSASSSRHLSSFLCQTVPIWNRLPSSVISSTSLSSFRSAVRRHFVSDMFTYGLS